MAPIIKVSEETLRVLNPDSYTLIENLSEYATRELDDPENYVLRDFFDYNEERGKTMAFSRVEKLFRNLNIVTYEDLRSHVMKQSSNLRVNKDSIRHVLSKYRNMGPVTIDAFVDFLVTSEKFPEVGAMEK